MGRRLNWTPHALGRKFTSTSDRGNVFTFIGIFRMRQRG